VLGCRQLNEIWPTGGWGSLEYGTPSVQGQVVGGRWKPLHYLLKSSTFADVLVACGADGQCFLKNDLAAKPFSGQVLVESVFFR
jgi:beta-mannosidase